MGFVLNFVMDLLELKMMFVLVAVTFGCSINLLHVQFLLNLIRNGSALTSVGWRLLAYTDSS
jgi:hypothetical protein